MKNIVAAAVIGILLFMGFDKFTRSIYADEVNLVVYLKTYKNTDIRLFYSEKPREYTLLQSQVQLGFASRYYKGLPFKLPELKLAKNLRLDLGDFANNIVIQKVELSVNNVSHNEIIGTWEGSDVEKLISEYNDSRLLAKNSRYIQIGAGVEDPFIVLNDIPYKKLTSYYAAKPSVDTAQLMASIFLTLFLLSVIIYFLPRLSLPGFPQFVRNGGVLVTGAILILAVVFLNNKFRLIPDHENSENRVLATEPELTLANFFNYPDLYTAYTKDNFAFRNHLFYMHSQILANVFHESPMPEDALLGKDGWFFDNEAGDLSDYRRITKISPEELAIVHKSFFERKKWLDERGIKFYILIPPNKHSVYPEYLPPGFFETEGIGVNRALAYKQFMEEHLGLSVVYPTDALKEAKKQREVYYKTDTHWNLYGGFIGYREMMKVISRDFPYLKPANESDFNFASIYTKDGDLAKVAGLNDDFKRQEFYLAFKDSSKHLFMPSSSEIVLDYNNKTIDGSHLKLLMCRDSYANYLIPFFNLHFEKAKYVWSYDFPDKMIEEDKPDVVIFESLQRFMAEAFWMPNPESLDTSRKAAVREIGG